MNYLPKTNRELLTEQGEHLPTSSQTLRYLLTALLCFLPSSVALSASLNDIEAVPHLDKSGKNSYQEFLMSNKHRAFAISPGGTWGWKGGESSPEAAAEEALLACQLETEQKCVLYASNDNLVFDNKVWATLWGPYLNQVSAKHSPVGTERGARFYDLAFKDAAGKTKRISELRGKVVLLHFWGSWCPPCQRELPELQKLQQSLRKSPDIKMVLLQVREDFSTSRKAIAHQQLNLILHDSGSKNTTDDTLRLSDGRTLHDRDVAAVFPTTYILDKQGIVLFSHTGPVSDWLEYLPFLRDAASKSGK